MSNVWAALKIGSGASCALGAGGAVAYTVLCYAGVFHVTTIDAVLPQHHPSLFCSSSLLNNTLLLLLFFVSHSLLSRCWVKEAFSPLLSPSLYRQIYFLISSFSFFLIPYGWSPMPYVLWHVDIPGLKYSLYGITMCGVVLIVVAFFSLKPLEFCGMQEPINTLTGTSHQKQQQENSELMVKGVYGLVRHPMYTGVLIILWSQPTMTQGRVLIAIALSLYLFIAVPYLEEPDLLQVFGHQYQDYMKTTGMFIPHLPHLGKKKES